MEEDEVSKTREVERGNNFSFQHPSSSFSPSTPIPPSISLLCQLSQGDVQIWNLGKAISPVYSLAFISARWLLKKPAG